MRVLVLDGSRVLPSLVKRLAPAGTEVEIAASFDQAKESLCRNPPQGVIVNLTPAPLPWGELLSCCRRSNPPIPVLFESCVYRSAEEAGIGELGEDATFLAKPYHVKELREQIERMIELASGASAASAADAPAVVG